MSYLVFKRLVEFFGEPNMTVGEFLEIVKKLRNF